MRQELQQLYLGWAEKYPNKGILQLMLGNLFGNEKSKAEPYYLKAVALDPKLAQGFMELSLIAETRGENEQRRAYLKKAAEAAPEDPLICFTTRKLCARATRRNIASSCRNYSNASTTRTLGAVALLVGV
jgi:tetratricopeptide (TPR) repeat protein